MMTFKDSFHHREKSLNRSIEAADCAKRSMNPLCVSSRLCAFALNCPLSSFSSSFVFLLASLWLILSPTLTLPLHAQTIAEKKANLQESSSDLDPESEQYLKVYNDEMTEIQRQLKALYNQANELYQQNGPEGDYETLLKQINELKQKHLAMENTWRDKVSRHTMQETYGLWLAPETTLEQLVIDYGSQDYVYLIPAEVGSVKLSVDSNLPIPRASWSEMLELILSQNGVGIRTLSPFLRQLYFLKTNNSILTAITNQRKELDVLPAEARVGFVLSPEPSEVRRAYVFLEKFLDQVTTSLHMIGRDILIIGSVSDVQHLLMLYDFVATNRGDKEYQLVPLFKINAPEMAKILEAVFDHEESTPVASSGTAGGGAPAMAMPRLNDGNGLQIIALENMAQSLFLVGTKGEIRKAEEVIRKVENQLSGAREKVVFWYTTKNSNAEELAEVLQKVYYLMATSGVGFDQPPHNGVQVKTDQKNDQNINITTQNPPLTGNQIYTESFYQDGGYVINPAPAQPGLIKEQPVNEDRDNFIVDAKTGSIVMVVEADILPKMKDLLKKLDVPKKMVQIETLLFERRVTNETNYGMNLLKIGAAAANINATSFIFNNIVTPKDELGITQFLMSRKKSCCTPAFDLAYRFLLSQDDVQINASPSVLAVNQTPATISIVDEISINTGIFAVETSPNTLKDAFTRAQYGITIEITPTIHMGDENDNDDDEGGVNTVTLDTDVTFDTIQPGGDRSRPDVARRHIVNQVQVPDGQTVILGGLRRKQLEDGRDGIPFISDIPYLGKLVSYTTLKEASTEMFIFITPKIVSDPAEDLAKIRCEQLSRRPGDLPIFLERLQDARIRDKFSLMHRSMRILFGLPRDGYYDSDEDIESICECEGEYDGR